MEIKGFDQNNLRRLISVFFRDALRITLTRPRMAAAFIRTLFWFRKAEALRKAQAKSGIVVPPIMLLSVTSRCNLSCKGCYAKALHEECDDMSSEKLSGIVREAASLGISFLVIAGGEPFMRPEIFDIAREHPQVIFLVFTNGLLLDRQKRKELRRLRNIVPMISLEGKEEETDSRRGEGVYSRIQETIRGLKREGIFFGTSLTMTAGSFDKVTGRDFVQGLVEAGCRFFLTIEYTAVECGTEDLLVSLEQRMVLAKRLSEYRKMWPVLFIAVPGDEEAAGGCLSAGRGFVHISAKGDLEPCPFAPFSDTNIRDMTLAQALRSPLLARLREYPAQLHENGGGCILWQKREWVKSLIEKPRVVEDQVS